MWWTWSGSWTGDAPDDAADDFEDEWEDRLDDIGVSLDDLDTLVQAQGDDGTVLVFGGDLDFEEMRDELDDARYDDDDYQGYEVWEDGDLWVETAALLDAAARWSLEAPMPSRAC